MQNNDYLQVDNNIDLLRDKKSKAIINTNKKALENAIEAKRKRLQIEKDVTTLKTEVTNIKNMLDKILTILETND